MNSLKMFLIVTLMSASVAAMAEGGGDLVVARSQAATATAMKTSQPSGSATAIAGNQKAAANETARTN